MEQDLRVTDDDLLAAPAPKDTHAQWADLLHELALNLNLSNSMNADWYNLLINGSFQKTKGKL